MHQSGGQRLSSYARGVVPAPCWPAVCFATRPAGPAVESEGFMTRIVRNWALQGAGLAAALVFAYLAGPSLSALSSLQSYPPPPPPPPECQDCDHPKAGAPPCKKPQSPKQGAGSGQPVIYGTGRNALFIKELRSGGMGGWGHVRNYLTTPGFSDGLLGPGWRVGGLMQLAQNGAGYLVVSGGATARAFVPSGSGFVCTMFYLDTLAADAVNHTLVYTDDLGRRWTFFDFSAFWTSARRGKLKQFADEGGNLTTFIYSTTAGPTLDKILEAQQTLVGAPTTFNRFLYAYYLSGVPSGRLSSVTHQRSVAGVASTVRKVDYSYYATSGVNGPAGTLQWSRIGDGVSVLEAYYHRYNALDAQGRPPLRYVLSPEGYDRARVALGSDAAIEAAGDATLAQWADHYFEYDASLRVTKEVVQGKGCGCGSAGSKGSFTYAYASATHGLPEGPNTWKSKVVETLPDGNQNIVYTSGFGATMLEIFKEVATGNQWRTYYRYDARGRLQIKLHPSAMLGHDEALPDLVGFNTATWTATYASTTQGLGYWFDYDANGNKTYDWVRQGQSMPSGGNAVWFRAWTAHLGSTGTVYVKSKEGAPFDLASNWSYVNYSYAWQGSTQQITSKVTSYEAVAASENGSGGVTSVDERFDTYGSPTWRKDEEGFMQALEYEPLTGMVSKVISDVNTAVSANEPAGWTTPAGGGSHLSTTLEIDPLGRTTAVTDPLGVVTYSVHNDLTHETRTYPGWNTATNLPAGPTQVVRHDEPNGYRERLSMTAAPAVVGGRPTGAEPISGVVALERDYLDTGGRITRTDSYHALAGLAYSTAPNIGTLGTNYYRRFHNYDARGRKDQDVDWTGTITRTYFDGLNRAKSVWIGTDDTPTSGDWSPTNLAGTNLIKVSENEYDANGVGDGNLTRSRAFTSAAVSLDTFFQYDFRGRMTSSRAPDKIALRRVYDQRDRVWSEETYADADSNFVIGATELRFKREVKFDRKGQIYRTVVHNVNPGTGALGNRLTSNTWFNARGFPIKVKTPNSLLSKKQYDGAGRLLATFLTQDLAETAYADADDVVGDTVVEQAARTMDLAGNILQTTTYQRVATSAKTGDLAAAWAVADSRRTFEARWFDRLGRMTGVVDYGTNGDVSLVRPATAPAPNSSSSYIVTKLDYNAAGRLYRSTNNLAKVTETTFNALGRITKVVGDFVNGAAAETETDTDRVTESVYDTSGRLWKLVAHNPKGTGLGVHQQVTQFVYGTNANLATPAVYRNDLQVAEIHPDSDDTYTAASPAGAKLANGLDAAFDRVEFTYDYASRQSTLKDRRGVVRTMAYDASGRILSDAVTTLPATVNGAVRRLQNAYDSLSRVSTATSYDAAAAGNIVNQVKYTYDGWGQEIKSEQSHVGAVVAGTPAYQETIADGAVSGEAKYARTSLWTYPNARQVQVNYPGALDDRLSRPGALAHSAGAPVFAQYTYLGLSTPVKVAHPQVTGGLNLSYGTGTGSPAGWDRFGRVVDQKWGSDADANKFDRQQYTYDRVGSRLTRDVTYTGAPANRDEQYTYDGLHRLKTMKRGTLAGTAIADTASTYNQEWTALETLGNWRTMRIDPDGGAASAGVLAWNTQDRKHNKANEVDVDDNDANVPGAAITQSGGAALNLNWVDPLYDKAGNMIQAPRPGAESTASSRLHLTYDAWNRLATAKQDNGAGAPGVTLAEYQYDARGWRIAKLTPNGVNWNRVDYFFNTRWQVVEERSLLNTASKTIVATVPKFQYVWDLMYVDAPALRDENKDGDGDCVDGTDQRIYYCYDANFKVTTLVSPAGAVLERVQYDAYGKATLFNAAWSATQSAAVYANPILFGGYSLSPETGLYHARNREYHAGLGAWIARDPTGYLDSPNLYAYVGSDPAGGLDPYGLEQWNAKIRIKFLARVRVILPWEKEKGEQEYPGDDLWEFKYYVKFKCKEQTMEYHSKGHEANPIKPEKGFAIPNFFEKGKEKENIVGKTMTTKGVSDMEVIQESSCLRVTIKADFSVTEEIKWSVKGINVELSAGTSKKVDALFKICCCCVEDEKGNPTWSWFATWDKANSDIKSIWYPSSSNGYGFGYYLNADVGNCGVVKDRRLLEPPPLK
jgi:RHS repeat-associated protein